MCGLVLDVMYKLWHPETLYHILQGTTNWSVVYLHIYITAIRPAVYNHIGTQVHYNLGI